MGQWFKESWLKACFALSFFIFAVSFGYSFLIRTQPNPIIQTGNQLTGTINLQDLISSLAASNLAYLTVALVIIGFLAGAFYLFNFKPLQDQLKKQEENNIATEKETQALKKDVEKILQQIEVTKTRNEQGLKNLEKGLALQIDKRIFSAEEKISNLGTDLKSKLTEVETEASITSFITTWDSHYMWQTQNVPENVWRSLVTALGKSIEYEEKFKSYFAMPLVLKTMSESIDKYKGKVQKKSFETVLIPLSRVKGFEAEKAEIIEKISKLNQEGTPLTPQYSRLPPGSN
ncbi:MAG: hypothetical protein P4L67_02885 [Candidatus Pacebacteria bacterium]|nr:hypothetical protein [Candidatus Paceibacterota bacterium]